MKNEIIKGLNTFFEFGREHLPVILTGVGTVFFGATVYEVAKKTPEVQESLKEKEKEKGESLTITESGLVIVKGYAKPIALGTTSLACFYSAQGINSKRMLALTGAYVMKDAAFQDYREAAEKILGKKKEEKVYIESNEQALKRRMESDIPVENAAYGQDLFYIRNFDKAFRCDVEHILQAFNAGASYMSTNDYVTINYILQQMGISQMYGVGDDYGFRSSTIFKINGYDPGKCQILRLEDIKWGSWNNKPCGFIDLDELHMEYLGKNDIYDNQFRY